MNSPARRSVSETEVRSALSISEGFMLVRSARSEPTTKYSARMCLHDPLLAKLGRGRQDMLSAAFPAASADT